MFSLKLLAFGGVLASLAASSTVDFGDVPDTSIQPQGRAFSIWGLIFPSIVLASSLYSNTTRFPLEATLCTTTALLLTVPWSLAVRAKTWWLAFAFLSCTAMFNWLAVGLAPFDVKDASSWIVQIALSTFAGWTTTAAALNLAIADRTFDNPRVLVVIAVIVSALCLLTKRPLACLAYIWALAFQKERSFWTWVSLGLTVAGGAVSSLRTWGLLGREPLGLKT
tara:strand:- start:1155 stop:1823 length:669 start_codon:yes stop_codon:yes gene_type:complete